MREEEFGLVLTELRKMSESTYTEYERHLKMYKQWIEEEKEKSIFDGKTHDVSDYVTYLLNEDYSASSINVWKAALGNFYKEAQAISDRESVDIDIGKNYAREVNLSRWNEIDKERKRKDKSSESNINYIKPREVRKLAENAPEPNHLRNKLLIRLAFQTGLRRKELVRLKLDDVDRVKRKITVRGENAKNGRKRVVSYQPSLDNLMENWIERLRPSLAMASSSDYLFPTNRTEHIKGQRFTEIVREAADNAGIQEVKSTTKQGRERRAVTPHTLRHSFAMAAIDGGWSLHILKEAMGHSSVETTEMYLHKDEEMVMENFRNNGVDSGR